MAAMVSRAVIAPIAAVAIAVSPLAGSAVAEPPATQVVTVVAVGPNGQPINGYQEATSPGNVITVSGCTTPSPPAVGDDIYIAHPAPRAPTRVGRRCRDRCYAWATRGTSGCIG
jgi:hypothetical protein